MFQGLQQMPETVDNTEPSIFFFDAHIIMTKLNL